MIKIGNILIIVFLVTRSLSAAGVTTSLSENSISVGESTVLKISVTNSGFFSADPDDVPKVPGLTISYYGTSQHMTFINGKFSRGVALNYRITPQKPGNYTIPPITITVSGKKMHSQQVTLTVTKGTGTAKNWQSRREDSDERGDRYVPRIELSQEQAFVGEPVVLRYYVLSTVENFKIIYMMQFPELKGFLFREIKEQRDDVVVKVEDREFIKRHAGTFIIIPSGAGKYSIGGGVFRVRFQTFPFGRDIDVNFDTKEIVIGDYPVIGRPEGFKSNTGDFKLHVAYDPGPVDLYQEKRITVTVEGTGNLLTISKPVLAHIPDVKFLSEEGKEEIRLENDVVKGTRQFFFTCIPEKPGDIKLGTIDLTFFDPRSQTYKTVKSKEISFTATGVTRKKKQDAFDSDNEKKFDFNVVYVLAIILVFAGGIIALVSWERKRYQVLVNGETEKKEEVSFAGQHDDGKDHFKEMKVALEVGDSDVFLNSANKLVSTLQRQQSVPDPVKLETLRSTIYNFRYGGGKMSKDEMERIFAEIKGVVN